MKKLLTKTSFNRFRIWLTLLILVLLTFYFFSTGITIFLDYELTEERAKRIAHSLVSALDEHAARTFGEADQALLNVSDAIYTKKGVDEFNELTLHELLLSKKQKAPQIGEIFVVNSRGVLLASSSTYPIGHVNVSESEYFLHFREIPDSDFFISRPNQNALSKVWRIVLARGIRDSNGRFQGIVAIGIISNYFNSFYRSVDVGAGGFVDLVRRDGKSLIHEPFSERYTTVDFSKYQLFSEQLPKASFGTYFSQSPITFKTYLRSYHTVNGFPLVAVISLLKEDIFKQWYSRLWSQGVSSIILLALVSILGILLFRHLKKLEIAEEAQSRLIAIIESSDDAIIGTNQDGIITSWNKGAEKIYGYTESEVVGQPLSILVPSRMTDEEQQILARIKLGEHIEQYRTVRRRKDGQDIHMSITISPVRDQEGRIVAASTIGRDITKRQHAEEALRRAHAELELRVQQRTAALQNTVDQLEREIGERLSVEAALKKSEANLRYLASQLMTAQEVERERISRELHDELGQSLLVLKLQTKQIERQLRQTPAEAEEGCREMSANLNQLVDNVRRISRDLSPAILNELGLSLALQHLIREFAKRHNLRADFKVPPGLEKLFTREAQLNIYRICQESLTNIGKYAQASSLRVAISQKEDQVSFLLADNGQGFVVEEAPARESTGRGLGLKSMKERVRMLGGSLDIWSQEGQGTQIFFTLPIINKPAKTAELTSIKARVEAGDEFRKAQSRFKIRRRGM